MPFLGSTVKQSCMLIAPTRGQPQKVNMLFLLVLLTACCWAQTVVYTTGPNGEVSAYLIVGNTTNTTDSSSTSYSGLSSSLTSVYASTTSSSSTVANSSTSPPLAVVLPTTPYSGQSLLTGT